MPSPALRATTPTHCSGYAVGFGDVRAASLGLGDAARELRAELSSLSADVSTLLTEGWRGGAARAFETGWHEWHAVAADVIARLETLARELGT